MTKHDSFDETLLSAYLDNELSQHERVAVEEQLKSSEEMRKLLDELQSIRSMVQQLHAQTPKRSFEKGPWNESASENSGTSPQAESPAKVSLATVPHSTSWNVQRLASLAALLVIGLGVGGLWLANTMRSNNSIGQLPTDKPAPAPKPAPESSDLWARDSAEAAGKPAQPTEPRFDDSGTKNFEGNKAGLDDLTARKSSERSRLGPESEPARMKQKLPPAGDSLERHMELMEKAPEPAPQPLGWAESRPQPTEQSSSNASEPATDPTGGLEFQLRLQPKDYVLKGDQFWADSHHALDSLLEEFSNGEVRSWEYQSKTEQEVVVRLAILPEQVLEQHELELSASKEQESHLTLERSFSSRYRFQPSYVDNVNDSSSNTNKVGELHSLGERGFGAVAEKRVDAKPNEVNASDNKPNVERPNVERPGDADFGDGKFSKVKSDDAEPDEAPSSDARPSDARPSDARPSDPAPLRDSPVDMDMAKLPPNLVVEFQIPKSQWDHGATQLRELGIPIPIETPSTPILNFDATEREAVKSSFGRGLREEETLNADTLSDVNANKKSAPPIASRWYLMQSSNRKSAAKKDEKSVQGKELSSIVPTTASPEPDLIRVRIHLQRNAKTESGKE
jgi:hypothetical protein